MAMSLARAYERRLREADPAPTATAARPMARAKGTLPVPPLAGPSNPKADGGSRPKFRRLSPEELAEKRRKGECFFCSEQFGPEHKCISKGIFLLEFDDDASEEDAVADLGISLHALTGISTANSMRLHVRVSNADLLALVDSGSTHTFINTATAQRLGLHVHPRPGLSVKVANGDRVASLGLCPDMSLHVQGEAFYINTYALALDGFDIVLGVQWLASLGPIVWDFAALSMEFWRDGRVVRWSGVGSSAPAVLSIGSATDLMEALLLDCDDVFAVPTTLPPVRRHDHRIHLLPGAAPVAVRPYRYPQLLKDEIERQREDMLAQGIIRHTSLPFSSPVLLVRKHDGSWRFCVDYRALNDKTVKDKFPISVVDELLDELKGARFFTKLDLRSSYHQVRMHPDDVAKTAFYTHHGHFEFLLFLGGASTTRQGCPTVAAQSFSLPQKVQCFFGKETVVYLGHIISSDGVAMDPDKVAAVEAWPRPRTIRALCGFLGLTGYYRKFIAGYGSVAHALTALLKREAFSWAPEAEHAFVVPKRALMSAPLLQLPDFSARFVVDCDASGSGFGAVLHQGDGAIAFFSRPVAPQHAKLPAYERELIGLVKAVRHWRLYLWGQPFTVRTDHWSLNFLLDQRLTTIPQHTLVSKLFGYDFTVEYRPGKQNVVADTLSCRDEESSLAVHALTRPPFDIFSAPISKQMTFVPKLLLAQHRMAGRMSMGCCCSRAVHLFWMSLFCGLNCWMLHILLAMRGLKNPCIVFEPLFTTVVLTFGLESLSVAAWSVNATRLNIFIQLVYCSLFGFPLKFGATLLWILWKGFLKLGRDGQSEVTNRTIVMYLRCLAGDRSRSCLQWQPWAEYCYNTSYQSSLRTTPVQVVYGREPPNLLQYQLGTARVAAVDRQLQDRDLFLAEIRERLFLARDTMKLQFDKKRRDLSFQVGDWVWVRLHHRTATAITSASLSKLSPRFYGPYEVIKRIGEVAYRLRLQVGAKIHDVFHVALLKALLGLRLRRWYHYLPFCMAVSFLNRMLYYVLA
ncbi:hypothetical protein U9M48_040114 [Paspalum notatum var. saurae]|uniref:Reverse transcriptase n=1 Tax=Paspalum notatum var. saurae TaxID=547442 RepID=A0AAQ3UPT1_PASNO